MPSKLDDEKEISKKSSPLVVLKAWAWPEGVGGFGDGVARWRAEAMVRPQMYEPRMMISDDEAKKEAYLCFQQSLSLLTSFHRFINPLEKRSRR